MNLAGLCSEENLTSECCNVDRHYFSSSQVTTFKNQLQLYLISKYGEIVVCKCIFLNEILKILHQVDMAPQVFLCSNLNYE